MTQLFVYKCRNDPQTHFAAYGDWETVFSSDANIRWGGSWATNSASSKRLFEEEIKKGDLILAWQSDKRGAVGVCEVRRFEYTSRGQELVIRPIERFPSLVRLHELKKTTLPELQTVAALKQGNVATLYETSRDEARLLLTACGSSHARRFARRTKQ
ncbi:MAG TPA: EVE domain-containing protein [Fimbriimonadaceae bacterium]|nr:EVE domain-containing protein [Fimbriimonadaceae bacterium]